MKQIFLTLILVPTTYLIYSQNVELKRNQLIDYLYFNQISAQDVNSNHHKELYFTDIYNNIIPYDRQVYIKSSKNLYLILEGTGMVFKAVKLKEKTIEFERIDSTVNFGYNFLAINLCHKDTLFSFGGYGFWKFNGQLRYFMNGEWLIAPVNKEIFILDHINFLDLKKSVLYSISHNYGNEAEKKNGPEIKESYVIKTDLNQKNNQVVGEIRTEFKNFTEAYILWKSTKLKGPVIAYHQNIYLINFERNRIYKASNRKIFDQLVANLRYQPGYIFQNNDTVYYIRSNDKDSLYYFTISQKDFETEGLQFYTPISVEKKLNLGFIAIIGLGIVGGLIGWNYLKSKRKRKMNTIENKNFSQYIDTPDLSTDISKFNDFEINIIQGIIQEKIITVEVLNHLLGLSKKSLEIQKKSRNDVIHRINHKFRVIFNSEVEFIERIRSEEDRRYFKYTINEANQQLFKDHQKKHS